MKVSARNNNKNIIAKKPLTNLYEMNSSLWNLYRGLLVEMVYCDFKLKPSFYKVVSFAKCILMIHALFITRALVSDC